MIYGTNDILHTTRVYFLEWYNKSKQNGNQLKTK
jgi:hypothetical protein